MPYNKAALTGTLLLVAIQAFAQQDSGLGNEQEPCAPADQKVWTLLQIQCLADREAPALKAAHGAVRAAQARHRATREWMNPELELFQDDVQTNPVDTSTGKTSALIGQPFSFSKRRTFAQQAADFEMEAARADFEATNRRTLATARRYFITIIASRELARTHRTLLADAENLAAIAAEKGIPQEVARARQLVLHEDLDVTAATANLVYASHQLRWLLAGKLPEGYSLRATFDRPGFDGISSLSAANLVAEQPEIIAAEFREKAARRRISEARAQRIPDPTFRAGGGIDNRTDEGYAALGLSIPLPLWNRNGARMSERNAEAEMLTAQTAELTFTRRHEIEDLVLRLNEYDTLAELTAEGLLPAVAESARLAREQYAAGSGTFLEALDAYRTHAQAATDSVVRLQELNQVYSDILATLPAESVRRTEFLVPE